MPTQRTQLRLVHGDARRLAGLADRSIDLVVTSPPYPLVEMWDAGFAADDPRVADALDAGDGPAAFEFMHEALDAAWAACARALKPGGFLCVNVGDATRTLGGIFRLYPNHARILEAFRRLGLTTLPDVLWRKQTNAPNKFMGSGMLPCGAYVTYEHEYVLIARKGAARTFDGPDQKTLRRESAYFFEERNVWFSDLWQDVKGARQEVGEADARERSAAFPFEIPYRLILMYSVVGDAVLDPFAGVGTTLAAAAAAGRFGVGYERERAMTSIATRAIVASAELGRARARRRLLDHAAFLERRAERGKDPPKHRNEPHGVPVVTGQETRLRVLEPASIASIGDGVLDVRVETCDPARFAAADPDLPFEA
jgi:modification methylase